MALLEGYEPVEIASKKGVDIQQARMKIRRLKLNDSEVFKTVISDSERRLIKAKARPETLVSDVRGELEELGLQLRPSNFEKKITASLDRALTAVQSDLDEGAELLHDKFPFREKGYPHFYVENRFQNVIWLEYGEYGIELNMHEDGEITYYVRALKDNKPPVNGSMDNDKLTWAYHEIFEEVVTNEWSNGHSSCPMYQALFIAPKIIGGIPLVKKVIVAHAAYGEDAMRVEYNEDEDAITLAYGTEIKITIRNLGDGKYEIASPGFDTVMNNGEEIEKLYYSLLEEHMG